MPDNERLLCKNLSLSIWLEQTPLAPRIKIRLVDKLWMKKLENTVEIKVEPARVTEYHITEGVVIAMRRLVSEAVKAGLISLAPGTSPPTITREPVGVRPITLSIPPDL